MARRLGPLLVLGLLAAPAASQASQASQDAVEREWAVRRRALAPLEHAAELGRALSSDDWTERYDALDALQRARSLAAGDDAGGLAGLARRAAAHFGDAHPNVRALALRAAPELVLDADGPGALAELVESLASDPHPDVRRALAARLTEDPVPGSAVVLARLAFDADAEVRREARIALLHFRPRDGREGPIGALADVLARIDREEGGAGVAETLWGSGRGGTARALDWDFASGPGDAAARASLRAAYRFAVGGGGERDARELVAGWLAPLGPDGAASWDGLHPGRRALLLAAAASPGFRALGEDARGGLARETLRAAEAGEDERAAAYLEGWLALAGPAAVAQDPSAGALSAELQLVVWERMQGAVEAWPQGAIARWLDGAVDPVVRATVVEVLAERLETGGSERLGGLLAGLLVDRDERIAARAFQVLAGLADPSPWHGSLYARWRSCAPRRRVELLSELSRGAAPVPFRDDLLELARTPARTTSMVELLGLFEGDERVRARLAEWLDELVGLLLGELEPSERRRLELQGRVLAEALSGVGGADSVGTLARALERVAAVSEELAKHLVHLLGRSPDGRAAVRPYARSEVGRLAIEAGLALLADGELSPVLAERYARCDGSLRARILKRLGAASLSAADELLLSVATGPDHRPEERVLALSGLVRSGRADLLARALDGAPDLEARVAAIDALGEVAGDPAATALLAVFEAERPEWEGPELELERRLVDWLPVRDALLPALVRAGAGSGAVLTEVLQLARHRARADLERRFRDRRTAATGFVYRSEIACARSLAAAGLLAEALESGARPYWELDGRLLLELAEAAHRAGAARGTARLLYRAALVALAGEPAAEDVPGLEVVARVRLAGLAWDERRWEAAAGRLAGLLRDRAVGRIPERSWIKALGDPDPAHGFDPEAQLRSAERQARAWRELDAGRIPGAESWAARAREVLGASAEAAAEQERLRSAIERAR